MAHSSPQFLSSAPGRCLTRLFLALLALAVISGGSLAAGDLFDDDYSDCPHKTRLRDGQISDLAVARDSEEADEVNVSWSSTDPTTWGLGPNAFRTELVLILEDDNGDQKKHSTTLNSQSYTFDDVPRGQEIKVQLAIVVDTADGDYLISDILEASTFQSLTKPVFMAGLKQHIVTRADLPAVIADAPGDRKALSGLAHVQDVAGGMFYYIGYNENFGNYKASSGLTTQPTTPRLRIGLAHGGESDDDRDDANFKAYIIRIEDENDVVNEGDDIATVKTDYKKAKIVVGTDDLVVSTVTTTTPEGADDAAQLANAKKLSVTDRNDRGWVIRTNAAGTEFGVYTINGSVVTVEDAKEASLSKVGARNVRINDDGVMPATLVNGGAVTGFTLNALQTTDGLTVAVVEELATTTLGTNTVFVEPPHEHRDFPIDVFDSDETYTISAWAVNDDDEVISPVASLKVRPIDTDRGDISDFQDYLNNSGGSGTTVAVTTLTETEFTVLK